MKSINNKAKELIKLSLQKPSEAFGDLVFEVDHRFLGAKVKKYRQHYSVKAVNVAEQLGISKVQLHFLEIGRKQWSYKTLVDYLDAVKVCRVNNKLRQKVSA